MCTDPAVRLAIQLMKQLDATESKEAFWMFSIAMKMMAARPNMTMRDFGVLLRQQMPRTARMYREYVRTT